MNQHFLTLRTFSVCAFISFFLLTACSTQPATPEADTAANRTPAEVNIRKSPNDSRDYRYLVLPNELRVLLVSDPTTDRAAASLTVLRGYYHEPREYPGLAHFLEHMLFIGTEKYPEVDGYQQFISAHGGQSNVQESRPGDLEGFQEDDLGESVEQLCDLYMKDHCANRCKASTIAAQ